MKDKPWLDFYINLTKNGMKYPGLCTCLSKANKHRMRITLTAYMKPEWAGHLSFWGDEESLARDFSAQRQNIVLLMAAMNNEL